MKFLLKVDYNSNEHWDDTEYALLEINPADIVWLKSIVHQSRAFLKKASSGTGNPCGNTRLPLPGNLTVFGDSDDEVIAAQIGDHDLLAVPDSWTIPEGCETARTETDRLSIYQDMLWLETKSKYSGDYLEIDLGKEWLDNLPGFPKPKVKHAPCPVCSANVHGRVTVALRYLERGLIAKGKTELKMLLPLVEPVR